MKKIKEQIKIFLERVGLGEGNIGRVGSAVAVATVFLLGSYFWNSYFFASLWVFNGVLLTIVLTVVAIIAGFAVIKSLFLVAGELSLLIFLSESYCGVPQRAAASDAALKSLLVVGLSYIAITFVRSVYELSKENYQKVKKERLSVRKLITIALFLILTVSFMWEVYLVMSPIILNLCVYR